MIGSVILLTGLAVGGLFGLAGGAVLTILIYEMSPEIERVS